MPSDYLRQLISQEYNLDLEQYKWSSEFTDKICSYKTKEGFEPTIKTLREVFDNGYNIGNCDLTSRYLSINDENAYLHHGFNKYLVGTKNAKNGGHAWIESNGYVIDTSLMIMFPVELKSEFGYTTKGILIKEASVYLSEYNLYEFEKNFHKENPEGYLESLYTFGSSKQLKKEI